ncbi:MAG: homoserine kinase [Firmicutes bacterium]|nr:homoserine kinase [Bacillota bacterium]
MNHIMFRVQVPATTANIGSGFDCLGLALDLYNTLEVEEIGEGLEIQVFGEGAGELPHSKENLVYRSLLRTYQELGITPPPLRLKMTNEIPLARGLGSSAAAIVAGIVAANQLTGQTIPRERLLDLAVEVEGHPDNVTPALLGGLVISAPKGDKAGYHCLRLEPPQELQAVVCIPEFRVVTEDARRSLPEQIPHADAVFNIGRVSLLLGAIVSKRWDLLSAAMEDKLHQPYRRHLVPGLEGVFAQAMEAGALGVALSGSGPSVAALVNCKATTVGMAMEEAFGRANIKSRSLALGLNSPGAKIIKV